MATNHYFNTERPSESVGPDERLPRSMIGIGTLSEPARSELGYEQERVREAEQVQRWERCAQEHCPPEVYIG